MKITLSKRFQGVIPGLTRNPATYESHWTPAFAGVTVREAYFHGS